MNVFNPPKQRRLSEEIHRQIKEAILRVHYHSGGRLSSDTKVKTIKNLVIASCIRGLVWCFKSFGLDFGNSKCTGT